MESRLFIVDDHPVVRLGLADVCGREADLTVCGEAGTAAEALQAIPTVHPDLVLVDISLEGDSGLELVRVLSQRYPEMRTLVVSAHDEMLYAERALQAGADGYVQKGTSARILLSAIRKILGGGVYVSDRVRERLLQRNFGPDRDPHTTPLEQLSDRELQVFEHLARGRSTREIADVMEISPHTVGTYRERIKEKMGFRSTAELVRQAVAWGELNR